MITRALGCVVLGACAAAPPPSAVPEPNGAPTELQRAETLLQIAVDEVLRVDGRDLQDAYDDTMSLTDARCPMLYGSDYWFGGCQTDGGTRFDGYAQAYSLVDGAEQYWQVYGQASIGRPDGGVLELSGYSGWGIVPVDGITYDYSYAYGTFLDDGRNRPGWLSEGRSVAVYTQLGIDGVGAQESLYVAGSLGGLGGDVGQAADYLEVTVVDGNLLGVIGVRLPEGTWVDVFFDGPACGTAFVGDTELGEACADFSTWGMP